MGIGGDFDVKMRADATKSERFRDFDIYQAELSFEIDSEVGIAWEYLSFYQQLMIFDLSLLQIKPAYIHYYRENHNENGTPWVNFKRPEPGCFAWYQEMRVLPFTTYLSINFLNCYANIARNIWLDEEINAYCRFDPSH